MENKTIKRCVKRSILLLSVAFFLGMIFGAVLEKTVPSDYKFTILSEEEIYTNNITALKQTIVYGFLSFGLYSVYFCFIFGKIVGQGLGIFFSNFGVNGVIYGFLPHAGIEAVSCLCAAVIPVFGWNIILNTFLKKSDIVKKKMVFRSIVIMLVTAVMVFLTCHLAAYIEYNVTEMFWQNQ